MKEEKKQKLKKVLKVTGLVTGGAIIGAGSVIAGQKILKHEKDDSNIIVTTEEALCECAKEIERQTFFKTLTVAQKCCEKSENGIAMLGRNDSDPEHPKYLMAQLLDELPEGYENNFIEPQDLDIFGK